MPLAAIARRLGVVVILVRHLNKSTGGKAIYRGGGSIGLVGAVRAAFLIGVHPDDETARVLACVKSNLGPRPPALVYRLSEDPVFQVARIGWHGPLEASAQDLLDGPDSNQGRRRDVEEFLRYATRGGPIAWVDLVNYGKESGYTSSALLAHRNAVLEKVFVPGEGNRGVTWRQRAAPAGGEAPHTEAQVEQPLPAQPEPEESPEDVLDEQLRARPAVCDICGHDKAMRFGRPHWVVRCSAHNPMTYGRGA
jgi:hypothetical protein